MVAKVLEYQKFNNHPEFHIASNKTNIKNRMDDKLTNNGKEISCTEKIDL